MLHFRDISQAEAIIAAIKEFDKLGREQFLKKYGYGKSRRFVLVHNSNQYDSKAIIGAAYQYQFGRPLKNSDFSGGAATVVRKLEELGFQVSSTGYLDEHEALPEEITSTEWEGTIRSILVNKFERSAKARKECVKVHGHACKICGIDFEKVYGEEFEGLIHVHHIVPLSQIKNEYQVDPVTDLIPLCPNCHAVIHYKNKTRAVDDVRKRFLRLKS